MLSCGICRDEHAVDKHWHFTKYHYHWRLTLYPAIFWHLPRYADLTNTDIIFNMHIIFGASKLYFLGFWCFLALGIWHLVFFAFDSYTNVLAHFFVQSSINTIDMINKKWSWKWEKKYYRNEENEVNCMLRLPLTIDSPSEGTQHIMQKFLKCA